MAADDFTLRVQAHLAELPPTMRRVAQYIDQNRVETVSRPASELARITGTSDATIVRLAKALGFSGLPELKRSLAILMAQTSPSDRFRQTLSATNADAKRAIAQIVSLQQTQLAEGFTPPVLTQLQGVAEILDGAERIVGFGIGPTAFLVQYGLHLMRRHGRNTMALDKTGSDLADQMLDLRAGDAVLAFSYGRPYAEIEALMSEARTLDLKVILVTDVPESRLGQQAEVVVGVSRGDARGMALHGATLVWLEALIVALSVLASAQTASGLEQLSRLRVPLGGKGGLV